MIHAIFLALDHTTSKNCHNLERDGPDERDGWRDAERGRDRDPPMNDVRGHIHHADHHRNASCARNCQIYVYKFRPGGKWYGRMNKEARAQNASRTMPYMPLDVHQRLDTERHLPSAPLLFHEFDRFILPRLLGDPRRVMDPRKADVLYVDFGDLQNAVLGRYHYQDLAQMIRAENPGALFTNASARRHFWVQRRPIQFYVSRDKGATWAGDDAWQRHATILSTELFYDASQLPQLPWRPVPYPSLLAWSSSRPSVMPMQGPRAQPTILVSGVWGDRASAAGELRNALKHQCKKAPGICEFPLEALNQTFLRKEDLCREIDAGWNMGCSITALMRRSIFSLQPTGDSFGRRGIYDALSQGAIPVIFDNRSFFMPWHAPRARDFSVMIDPKLILRGRAPRSVIDILAAIPLTEVARLQRNIAKAGMQMHYASPQSHGCVLDAYEVIMQNMCRRATGKRHDEPSWYM